VKDVSYLGGSPIKQALSVIRSRRRDRPQQSYRKVFRGSILLSVQYRMHPSIAALPSAIFYDGLLSTPIAMTQKRDFPNSLRQLMPCADRHLCVRWIDVGGRNQERQGSPTAPREALSSSLALPPTSYWNPAEAERVVELVKELVADRSSTTTALPSIGIVTPYNGQVQCIQLLLAQDATLRDLVRSNAVEVKSVDGYQGRERDVIIVSTVRSNRRHHIGFVQDWRRMNVAFTRAKSALIVVSDIETLATADPHWDAFRTWATSVRCIVNDYDSPEDEAST
jgi:superfamily I DNA and/or RNA helicase